MSQLHASEDRLASDHDTLCVVCQIDQHVSCIHLLHACTQQLNVQPWVLDYDNSRQHTFTTTPAATARPSFPPALRAAAGVMDRPGAADYDVGKRGGWDSDKDGNVATLPPPTDTGAQPYVNLIAAY